MALTTQLAALVARTSLVAVGVTLVTVGLVVRRPTPLRPWLFVLSGLGSSLVGDLLVLADAVSPGSGWASMDASLTALAGLLLLIGMVDATGVSRGGDLGGTLDALLVAVAGGALLWHVVVVEAAVPGWIGTGTEVAGFIQVLSLVAVLALLLRTRQSLPVHQRTATTLLAFALLASVSAFLAGAVRDASGLVDQFQGARAGLGVAANLLVGVAVLHPSVTAITRPRQPHPEHLTRRRMLLLGGAMLVPPALLVVERLRGHEVRVMGLTAAWVLLVPTVLARLHLLMRSREQALSGAVEAHRRLATMLGRTGDLLLLVRLASCPGDPLTARPTPVVEYASPAARPLLGRPPDELEGDTPTSMIAPGDRIDVERLFATPTDWPAAVDVRVIRADGSVHWCEVALDHYLDDPGVAIMSMRDIDARKLVELGLSEAAQRDALTGVLNRRGLFDHVARLDVASEPGALMGCISLDLDGFKEINDRLGHLAGDEVLQIVAHRLTGAVRDGDTVGRPGGDEFVVWCPRIDGMDDLRQVGERILTSLVRPMAIDGGPARVGVSLGLATLRAGESSLALYARSDAALLAAKAAGKGRIVCADDAAADPVTRRPVAVVSDDHERGAAAPPAQTGRSALQS